MVIDVAFDGEEIFESGSEKKLYNHYMPSIIVIQFRPNESENSDSGQKNRIF